VRLSASGRRFSYEFSLLAFALTLFLLSLLNPIAAQFGGLAVLVFSAVLITKGRE
jgi:hypothetical protein